MPRRFLIFSLLAAGMLTGCSGVHRAYIPEIAEWRCFERDSFVVTIAPSEIRVMNRQAVLTKEGRWTNHQFTVERSDGEGVLVATELPDESLEVHMAGLDPQDSDVVVCTKTMRTDNDDQPYPAPSAYGKITYPPPKGLIREGMLEADVMRLPWKARVVEVLGDDSEVGPDVMHFRSDDPQLPELLVTVYKGRVNEVSGGAEETEGPSYVFRKNTERSWIEWILELFGV